MRHRVKRGRSQILACKLPAVREAGEKVQWFIIESRAHFDTDWIIPRYSVSRRIRDELRRTVPQNFHRLNERYYSSEYIRWLVFSEYRIEFDAAMRSIVSFQNDLLLSLKFGFQTVDHTHDVQLDRILGKLLLELYSQVWSQNSFKFSWKGFSQWEVPKKFLRRLGGSRCVFGRSYWIRLAILLAIICALFHSIIFRIIFAVFSGRLW